MSRFVLHPSEIPPATLGLAVPQEGNGAGSDGRGVAMPDGSFFASTLMREGSDLVVLGADGDVSRVMGYFSTATPADLVSPRGAVMRGEDVVRLAHAPTDGQYAGPTTAPAGAVGRVEQLEGTVSVKRTDGRVEALETGDAIYQNDILQTGPGSTLSVAFTDGTVFALAANSRMIVDTMLYSEGGSGNTGLFSLIEGSFVYIAGEVAKTGDMEVRTPSAVMGIRGTTVKVDIGATEGITTVAVSLNRDPDGSVGVVDLKELDGSPIATLTTTQTVWIVSPLAGETREMPRSQADLENDAPLLEQAARVYEAVQARGGLWEGVPEPLPESDPDPTIPFRLTPLGADPDTLLPPLPEPGHHSPENPVRLHKGVPYLQPLGDDEPSNPTSPVNTAPTIIDVIPIAFRAEETDGTLSLNGQVIAFDADGDTLHYLIEEQPEGGTVVLQQDGKFTFTPDADFNGDVSFNFIVSDGAGASDFATVKASITPVNDPPTGSGGALTTPEDTPLTGQVQAQDVDGDPLTYTLATAPQNGTLNLAFDGSYTYTPARDFTGNDRFTVKVADPEGASVELEFRVDVSPQNDAPKLEETRVDLSEDATAYTLDLRTLVSDPDGSAQDAGFELLAPDPEGMVRLDGATLSLTPAGRYDHLKEGESTQVEVGIRVTDAQGESSEGRVLVVVEGRNDAPTLTPVSLNTDADATDLRIDLTTLADDPDAGEDGTTLTYRLDTTTGGGTGSATPLPEGLARIEGGTLIITPEGRFDHLGASDTATLTINVIAQDQAGSEVRAAFPLEIKGSNNAPTLSPARVNANEDMSEIRVDLAPLASDADQGDTLTFSVGGTPAGGSARIEGTELVFTPAHSLSALREGELREITIDVTATDRAGASGMGQITLAITGINDLPEFTGGESTGTVVDGGTLSASGTLLAEDDEGPVAWETGTSTGRYGSFTLSADGRWTYTADERIFSLDGTVEEERFTVVIRDDDGASASREVVITVKGTDSPPVITGGTSTGVVEDGGSLNAAGTLLAQDDEGPVTWDATTTEGTYGSFSMASDGSWTYTADSRVKALGDESKLERFTATVRDSAGASVSKEIEITVKGVDAPPEITGGDTLGAVSESLGLEASGSLTARDDEGAVSWEPSVVRGLYGSFALRAGGNWSYVADERIIALGEESHEERFTAIVRDEMGASASREVVITVKGTDTPPAITGGTGTGAVTEGGTLNAAGMLTATDAEGEAIWQAGQTTGSYGSLTLSSNGAWVYSADERLNKLGNETREDRFTVVVRDSAGQETTGSVVITAQGRDTPPEIDATTVTFTEDVSGRLVDLSALARDAETEPAALTYTLLNSPTRGAAEVQGSTLVFFPKNDYDSLSPGESITETVLIEVRDRAGQTAQAPVELVITGVNDAPELKSSSDTVNLWSELPGSIALQPLFSDVDNDFSEARFQVVSPPSHGTARIENDKLMFDPGSDFYDLTTGQSRTVEVMLKVSDPHGASAIAAQKFTIIARTGPLNAPKNGDPVDLTNGRADQVVVTAEDLFGAGESRDLILGEPGDSVTLLQDEDHSFRPDQANSTDTATGYGVYTTSDGTLLGVLRIDNDIDTTIATALTGN